MREWKSELMDALQMDDIIKAQELRDEFKERLEKHCNNIDAMQEPIRTPLYQTHNRKDRAAAFELLKAWDKVLHIMIGGGLHRFHATLGMLKQASKDELMQLLGVICQLRPLEFSGHSWQEPFQQGAILWQNHLCVLITDVSQETPELSFTVRSLPYCMGHHAHVQVCQKALTANGKF